MRNSLVLVTMLAVAGSTPCHAAWYSLTDAKAPAAPALKAAGSLARFAVDVNIPGLDISDAGKYSTLRMPGEPRTMTAGEPELPLVTASLMLPDRGNPAVKLTVVEEKTIQLTKKIEPSRGHITRDIPLSTVPQTEGPVYAQDAEFPGHDYTVTVDEPYIARDVRGCAVRIEPVVYNPVKNTLRVLVRARLEVTVSRAGGTNEKVRARDGIDPDFAAIYRKTFINFDTADHSFTTPNENAGRAIVICADEWVSNVQPLLDWRATKGLETKLYKISDITGTAGEVPTADKTKAFIAAEYAKGNLTYVLLVADGDRLPPPKGEKEKADSDGCFVKLEGNDHIPDAFISRFSAQSAADVDVQVARAIAYDKTPVTGDDAKFYTKATGIASDQGSPTDHERADILRTALMNFRYTAIDQIYDPAADATKVAAAVNEGRGLINYIGHGSKTMWVSSRFTNSHVGQLTNGAGHWPMIWSVACVNGDFVRGGDCFAEAWAKAGTAADPHGCIGIVAASTNMAWVPPCDWQSAANDNAIREAAWTGGQQHLAGLIKACEQWGTTATSQGVMLIEQCNFFGDSSIQLRNDTPRQATVNLVPSRTRRAVGVKVLAGDKPVKNARVVLKTASGDPVTGVTGEDGLATVSFARRGDTEPQATVTVTGPNLVPVIQQTVTLP